jgi:hypothetical protein
VHCSRASLGSAACCETIAAENRLIARRLERDLTLGTALRADGVVHFARTVPLRLACCATVLAALWGAEVLRRVKFLFTLREGECCAAIAARKLLIGHDRKKKGNEWEQIPSFIYLFIDDCRKETVWPYFADVKAHCQEFLTDLTVQIAESP